MKEADTPTRGRKPYAPPQVLVTYTKDELAETIRPHGPQIGYGDAGCGCGGCGCGGDP